MPEHVRRFSMLMFVGGMLAATVNAETEVRVLTMNTEFFFDNEPPHFVLETPPSEAEFEQKARDLAEVINDAQANLVALVEVENEGVVRELMTHLDNPANWHLVFEQGRDNTTGQDVALLTTLEVVSGTATNFPDEREIFFKNGGEEDVNPSKVLMVDLRVEGQTISVIVAHLISKRGDNDAKRVAQSTVIRRHAIEAMIDGKNVIVMGDLNDEPGSATLRRIRGFDDVWGKFLNTGNDIPSADRFTFVHEGDKQLIDHILLSPSLRNEYRATSASIRARTIDLGALSDHNAVLARLQF